MNDEYSTRMAEILDQASDESGTLLTSEETADDAGRSLIQVAREADEFVASSEPMELLEAAGLETLPDGSEAESVSEAVAKGDPKRVEDLHRLLCLAKLGDRSDEEQLEDATGGIRETIRQAQSETAEYDTETAEYDTRVAEILDQASDESGTLLTPEGTADDAGHNLIEVAREADELVASSGPMELLEAAGLRTLPDGSEAESVSEAIAKGDPERVEDLHRLLRLAKLGDRSDEETLEDATVKIREAIQQAQSATDETMTEDTDQDDTSDQDGTEQKATADDESEAEAREGNGEEVDDLEDRLRAALSSPFETFGDEIGDIQEQIEEAAIGHEDVTDEVEETDDESDDSDEDDSGLLGLGDSGDGGFGSSDSSRLSTMAPPPSERADMHAVKRYSTMPKRNK